MVTSEQENAVYRVAECLKALNKAIDRAGDLGVTIKLDTLETIGKRSRNYYLAAAEIIQNVLPRNAEP